MFFIFLRKIISKKKLTMGKGDKKTRRGKMIMGSYGKVRPQKKAKNIAKPKAKAEKKA